MANSSKTPIKLIVGLGNPGKEYEQTRHNAGFWFIEAINSQYNCNLKFDKKFNSIIGRFTTNNNQEAYVLMPQSYMNLSGAAVQAFCQFYKINPEEILVAHDELDYPAGVIKIKQSGGAGGHNGIKDIISKFGGNGNFNRLRIGIGHPRHSNNKQEVHNYVLAGPNISDKNAIDKAIEATLCQLRLILDGDIQSVMQVLHT